MAVRLSLKLCRKNMRKIVPKVLAATLIVTFILSLVNSALLLRLSFVPDAEVKVLGTEDTLKDQNGPTKNDKDDNFSRHLERLIVLDYIFDKEQGRGEELSMEELIIIDSLFRDGD